MKTTRRERKMIGEAKSTAYFEGYIDGYEKGLHDGNPFIALAEACTKVGEVARQIMTDPNTLRIIEEYNKANREELEESDE